MNFYLFFLDGSKELFEPCVTAVKSFLAGEPFKEFENSMYFHRYVMGLHFMNFCSIHSEKNLQFPIMFF